MCRLLWFVPVGLVVLCLSQVGFADCTDRDDQNGGGCFASPVCSPCGSNFQEFQSQRLLPNNQIKVASTTTKTTLAQSTGINVLSFRLTLLFCTVVLSTVHWFNSGRHKAVLDRGRP